MLDGHVVPHTGIVVDNFNDKKHQEAGKGTLFFLSHFHADHYGKLNKDWRAGPIYCSVTTAKLVKAVLEVDNDFLHPLPTDEWSSITPTCRVGLVDANHCPGAVMFLFHVKENQSDHWYLHTGDCRFSPAWKSHPLLKDAALDMLFLDTTYCDPKHTFPSQKETVEFIADTVRQHMLEDNARADNTETLFLIATYSVGKEKILVRLAQEHQRPFVVSEKKALMMAQLDLQWPVPFVDMFTTDHLRSNMHVVGWHMLGTMAAGGWTFLPDYEMLHDMIEHYKPRYHRIVAYIPTGWTYVIAKEHKRRAAMQASGDDLGALHHKETKGNVTVYTVPYSEHSSYLELRQFVSWLRPARVVPTVIGGGRNVNRERTYTKICSHFDDLINKKAASRNFLATMLARRPSRRASSAAGAKAAASKRSKTEGRGPAQAHTGVNAVEVTQQEQQQQQQQQQQHSGMNQQDTILILDDSDDDNDDNDERGGQKDNENESRDHLSKDNARAPSDAGNPKHQSDAKAHNEDHNDSTSSKTTGRKARASATAAAAAAAAAAATDDDDDDNDAHCGCNDDDDGGGGDGEDEDGGGNEMCTRRQSEKAQEICALLGDTVTLTDARAALRAGKGDMEAAVNALLDRCASRGSGLQMPTGVSSATALSDAHRIGTGTSTQPATAATATKKPKKQRQKTRATTKPSAPQAAAKGAAQASAKRDAGQRTLLTWLSPKKQHKVKLRSGKATRRQLELTPDPTTETSAGSSETAAITHENKGSGKPKQEGQPQLVEHDGSGTNGTVVVVDASDEDDAGTGRQEARLSPQAPGTAPDTKAATFPDDDKRVCTYMILASTFEEILKTRSRIKITALLKEMLCTVLRKTQLADGTLDADALIAAVYLSSNSIAPAFKNSELGIGESLVAGAVRSATGRSRKQMRADYKELGDLGDVAFKARASVRTLFKPKPLQVKALFNDLHRIARMTGQGSVKQKQGLVHKLLVSCRGPEIRFLVRTLISNLRIGAVGLTLQVALAHAVCEYRGIKMAVDVAAQKVKDAYARHPCWETIIKALLSEGGFAALWAQTQAQPGVPVRPMLGKITRDLADALQRLQGKDFQAEYKYDGVRAQIHVRAPDRCRSNASLHMFSRHLENVTDRYPDALQCVLDAVADPSDPLLLTISSCVLDAEIVAVTDTGEMLPFQTLMNRARKNVDGDSVAIRVRVHLFDIMHLNGTSLLKHPFRHRRQMLCDTFTLLPNRLDLVAAKTFHCRADGLHEPQLLRDFLHAALDAKCEGLMIKVLGPSEIPTSGNEDGVEPTQTAGDDDAYALSTYQPSKRCENWLKVKKDYVEGLSDSVDLVVIGAWWGNGRKAGWFSPFLLACYDEDTETYQSLCKVMSGFTDEFYKKTTKEFQEKHAIDSKRSYYDVSDGMRPSVWFDAAEVWEIKGADFTVSPVHTAARGAVAEKPGAGISLRFPRFIRKREDKTPEEATTSAQIAELYNLQFKAPQPSRVEETGEKTMENERNLAKGQGGESEKGREEAERRGGDEDEDEEEEEGCA